MGTIDETLEKVFEEEMNKPVEPDKPTETKPQTQTEQKPQPKPEKVEMGRDKPEHTHENGNAHEEYEVVESKDEQQIMEEVKGRLVDDLIYDFNTGSGRRVIGLSYAGVVMAARKQGNIHVEDVKIVEDDGKFMAKAKGRDVTRNFEIIGVASQRKEMDTRNGKIPDEFALVKAVAKAQRNVLRRLIPEAVIKAMIFEYKNQHGIAQ